MAVSFSMPILSFMVLATVIRQTECQPRDTIFAKGGTCLYKISDQWKHCMDRQSARLTYERDRAPPIYTRARLTESVNRIACCAYWEFLDCIQVAAEEKCPGEKRDMIAYSRQLGSAVPADICQEQFPRQSCNNGAFNNIQMSSSSTKSLVPFVFCLAISILFVIGTRQLI